jgi:hypothetical protein
MQNPSKKMQIKWSGVSLLPILILLGLGFWYVYAVQTTPPEFRALEGFELENELIAVAYISLLLSAISWWSLHVVNGKKALTREHIWPSLYTVGALFTLAATVIIVIGILADSEDLWQKTFGFLIASVLTLIFCLKDHQQLMAVKRKA